MKKIIILSFAFFTTLSCFKKEVAEFNTAVQDSSAMYMDSSAIAVEEDFAIDSTAQIYETTSLETYKIDYNTATTSNTSANWRRFLEDNPNYENKKEIEDKIIRAEVNEIANRDDTGSMPESEKTSSGNNKTSSIQIENDTSCDLTLRYSGVDAKMIIVPPNSKSKVSVSSGNYTVAATACGYNYAGRENLNGDYNVVYYISTTRY